MTDAGHPAGQVHCGHEQHLRLAMILRRLPAPAYPVRLADLTLWLRGVVQWRSGHVAASPDLRTMAPPTEPEFVDTEAGWHTA